MSERTFPPTTPPVNGRMGDMREEGLFKAAPLFPATRPEDVFGSLRYAGKPKTIEEMDAGILAEARRRHECD